MKLKAGLYVGTPISEDSFVLNTPLVDSDSKESIPAMDVCFRVLYRKQRGGELEELSRPVKRTARLFMNEKASYFTFEKLEAMGFNGDFKRPGFDSSAKVTLRCDHVGVYERWSVCLPNAPQASADVAEQLSKEWSASG